MISTTPIAKPKKDRKGCIHIVMIAGKEISTSSHTAVAHRKYFVLKQLDLGKVADHVIASRYNKIYGNDKYRHVMSTSMVGRARKGARIKSDYDRPAKKKTAWVLNWRAVLLEQAWR